MTIVIFLYKDGLPCCNSRIYGHQTTGKEYLMAKTADTIAIYSRKSRYTGKGESIGRSASAANISALTTAMPQHSKRSFLRTRAFPAAT